MALIAYIKKGIRRILKEIRPTKTVEVKTVSLAPTELLAGKTALITGGTSGIGRSIAMAEISFCVVRSSVQAYSVRYRFRNCRKFIENS